MFFCFICILYNLHFQNQGFPSHPSILNLSWGRGWDDGYGVDVDSAGSAYVTGEVCTAHRGEPSSLETQTPRGGADISFVFGGSGDSPVVGDWNGDGTDTIGVFRISNSTFYLRNSNSAGPSDLSFAYGSGSDKQVFGDWDGM